MFGRGAGCANILFVLRRTHFTGWKVTNENQKWQTYGPVVNLELEKKAEEWAARHKLNISGPELIKICEKLDSSSYNHNPNKFLGVSVIGTIATDILFRALGDQDYNPLHFKALQHTFLAKTNLYSAASRIGIIQFLRYRISYRPAQNSRPILPAALAMSGLVGTIYKVHGTPTTAEFVKDHIIGSTLLSEIAVDIEKVIESNSIQILGNIVDTVTEKVHFTLVSETKGVFTVAAYEGLTKIGEATGSSIPEAKSNAARKAIENHTIYPKEDSILSKPT